MTGTVRLFTALWPDASVRAQLAALRDAWRWPPGARPVADANLHATLHFIGSFRRDRLAALRHALGTVAIEPLRLELAGTDVWRGGIAVALLAAEPAVLALQARLGAALAGLGVDPRSAAVPAACDPGAQGRAGAAAGGAAGARVADQRLRAGRVARRRALRLRGDRGLGRSDR